MEEEQKSTILFTLIYGNEEYQVQTLERKYLSLMTLISDYVNISGFGLCCGMGSCGTCMVQIDGRFTLACQVPVDDWLANSEVKIEPSIIFTS
ncbi:2Fe-2S iron-sulfur cluster-binding protein [Dyadobacter sp. CY347]|uniref:2Fe-2S iron-sulfur cluster-binding protein n=1 Tax=Dyadobacter sp. CY347 TaxID=2909336 RepID=UPI001F265923|nr:2Fe-2S iron-sulfur cluster-binding protein [Dyadobacter sp. CY347]MCF2487772.1 2Fe-2S iron-sulfur cluster-binding protein [Dyadobacter sp. CY347]